ncbi:MAG: DNA repair protein RecN [Bacillota bacterium]
MVLNLFIKDFGIIEKTDIDMGTGLNVLTGETGSGKSIIIAALEVVSGGRALSEYIRSGSERSILQLTADIAGNSKIKGLLSDKGISEDDNGIIVLTREINISGRSVCRINGQVTTLNIYKEFGQYIIDIQGQHEQQFLFVPERQQYLLDAYGGNDLSRISDELIKLYREHREKKLLLNVIKEKYRDWARRKDTINYQVDEIDEIFPIAGEDDELQMERRKLVNIEKLSSLVNESYKSLQGGGLSPSLTDLAALLLKNLEKASELDSALEPVKDITASGLYQIEEACRELAAYIDNLEFYPSRLEYIEERLEKIERLKKKYGNTIEEVLSYKDSIIHERDEFDQGDIKAEILSEELCELDKKLSAVGAGLTEERKKASHKLEINITKQLEDLDMPGAQFAIKFTELDEIGENGKEKIEFYISVNAGEPLKPMSKVASGGEISRILLAIKGVLAALEDIPTLVFDEIDTGIGGRTIRSVAFKLCALSLKRQVICVTHSPIVASMADNHLAIEKTGAGGRTVTKVLRLINKKEKVEEIARMLGGDSEAAVIHARQMLEETAAIKKQYFNR